MLTSRRFNVAGFPPRAAAERHARALGSSPSRGNDLCRRRQCMALASVLASRQTLRSGAERSNAAHSQHPVPTTRQHPVLKTFSIRSPLKLLLSSSVAQWSACEAHNLEVNGSKPFRAKLNVLLRRQRSALGSAPARRCALFCAREQAGQFTSRRVFWASLAPDPAIDTAEKKLRAFAGQLAVVVHGIAVEPVHGLPVVVRPPSERPGLPLRPALGAQLPSANLANRTPPARPKPKRA